MNHTPGPWFVDRDVIRGDAQHNGSVSIACVLDVAYPHGRRAGDSTETNARLIAAAPELLASLKRLVRFLEVNDARLSNFGEIEEARAIITKVEEVKE